MDTKYLVGKRDSQWRSLQTSVQSLGGDAICFNRFLKGESTSRLFVQNIVYTVQYPFYFYYPTVDDESGHLAQGVDLPVLLSVLLAPAPDQSQVSTLVT